MWKDYLCKSEYTGIHIFFQTIRDQWPIPSLNFRIAATYIEKVNNTNPYGKIQIQTAKCSASIYQLPRPANVMRYSWKGFVFFFEINFSLYYLTLHCIYFLSYRMDANFPIHFCYPIVVKMLTRVDYDVAKLFTEWVVFDRVKLRLVIECSEQVPIQKLDRFFFQLPTFAIKKQSFW